MQPRQPPPPSRSRLTLHMRWVLCRQHSSASMLPLQYSAMLQDAAVCQYCALHIFLTRELMRPSCCASLFVRAGVHSRQGMHNPQGERSKAHDVRDHCLSTWPPRMHTQLYRWVQITKDRRFRHALQSCGVAGDLTLGAQRTEPCCVCGEGRQFCCWALDEACQCHHVASLDSIVS